MKSLSILMQITTVLVLTLLNSCKTPEQTTTNNQNNTYTDMDRSSVTKSSIEDHSGTDNNIPFIEIASGINSKFEKETYKIITDEETFESVWKLAYGNLFNPDPMPEVEFNNKILILVASGTRNSGGYYIQVSSIADLGGYLMVNVEETQPGEGCAVTEAITSPFQIIELDKPQKTIRFNTIVNIVNCK